MTKKFNKKTPAIYIRCLAAYNNGFLHGDWLELHSAITVDEIFDHINKVLETSPVAGAEEWAIHDMEYLPQVISEWESLETLCEIASYYDDFEPKVIEAFVNEFGLNSLDKLEDSYRGCYSSFSEFAQTLADEQIECYSNGDNNFLISYFDYDAFHRDLEISGEFSYCKTSFDETHIFDCLAV